MKFADRIALACFLAGSSNYGEVAAFSPRATTTMTPPTAMSNSRIRHRVVPSSALRVSSLYSPPADESSSRSTTAVAAVTDEADDEIVRLKAMAQKLRSEAASLEAEQAEERANVAKMAFEKFDTNTDGKISSEELKLGLEVSLKTQLSDGQVAKLMQEFDASGDGYLQQEEMVSVDQFRNKLEAFSRDEKLLAIELKKEAEKEEEMARLAEAKLEFLNEKEPTAVDKAVSVLPYLFPLMDSLQFGKYYAIQHGDNPLVAVLALLFTAYRTIPFSGFLAFIALNVLQSNPGLNRLVRYNMRQAIFLDIALFFPSIGTALVALLGSVAGFQVPDGINEAGSTAIFGVFLLTFAYATISSVLGITPDKIPIVSQAVDQRMLTLEMFDDQGRFVPRELPETKGDTNDDDKKKD